MNYAEWNNADLEEELKSRGLKSSGNKDEMAARLELDDEERQIDGSAPPPPSASEEPGPSPDDDVVAADEEGEGEDDSIPQAVKPRYSSLPATHQREKQDESVRYTILPDGRRVPWDD